MRCLYCGKQLALFRRLTGGGEFCSDAHKTSYQEEFNRLALARLKQAQEKSDELRAAAPQNQLALTRRAPGEPESPSIRSNAHWIEAKQGRLPQKNALALSAPAIPAQPDPKEHDFIKDMPSPAKPGWPAEQDADVHPMEHAVDTQKPEWNPALELPASDPVEGAFIPGTVLPDSAKPLPVPWEANSPDAVPFAADLRKPDWNPVPDRVEVSAAGPVPGPVPRPLDHQILHQTSTPSIVEIKKTEQNLPLVAPVPRAGSVYPTLPRTEIDPLQFAPAFQAELEARSQFLPFQFEFTAYPAPDFDILEPVDTPVAKLKARPRPFLKRTEQEHVLEPPAELIQPVRRRNTASAPALELGMIGEIAALATPATSLYPRLATPGEANLAEAKVEADAFLPSPPAVVMHPSPIDFRSTEKAAAVAVSDDEDDKRPSALKVKLAAMATPPPAPAPPSEASKPPIRQTITPNRPPERKPVERSGVQPTPARIMSTPRRRTVPIPSILELPQDAGYEQKSLWGALRKYLGK